MRSILNIQEINNILRGWSKVSSHKDLKRLRVFSLKRSKEELNWGSIDKFLENKRMWLQIDFISILNLVDYAIWISFKLLYRLYWNWFLFNLSINLWNFTIILFIKNWIFIDFITKPYKSYHISLLLKLHTKWVIFIKFL